MKKIFPIVVLVVLSFFSCTTKKSVQNFYTENPSIDDMCNISIHDITVVVNHVREKEVEAQIAQIVQDIVEQNNTSDYSTEGDLDISINQRSYIDGSDQKNSLFISCIVTHDGKKLCSESMYLTGTANILSSVEQYQYLNEIVSRIFKKRNKAYNGIMDGIMNEEK